MVQVDIEKCIGCGQCVKECFPGCIKLDNGKAEVDNKFCFKCGHCIAVCPKKAVSMDEYSMEDVKEYDREKFSVDADNLLNFIKFRRTIRQFKDKKVEQEKIDKLIEAGRFTETGSNAQDVSYTVVKENLSQLKNLTYKSMRDITDEVLNSRTLEAKLFRRYAKMWIQMCDDYKENPKNDRIFFNAPLVIVVTASSEVNAALASSNMELMANAMGLGVLFSGFFVRAAKDNKDIKEFLQVKRRKEIVTCMVIGYPDVKYVRTVPRKKADVTWK
ncbi:nitroreductase [Clostridium tyrobutyricum]|jgi:nitroreductase/NAD-dependent dihydropyrimidine dehydrogenase PreA subunit|uniref:Ferredoxin n=1 Tax=Clostridium tyrobutyricum DIVETGP TaxID=1408889 RepID=W6N7N7_CLOTY|nr:nitroreductase family protein [Clostridium tyrobutyricum]AND83565.1 nitroreductase [Clostridium tyrobutyricum]ANP68348.1 nitroreductase [Clostridium tyrobutyricum]MBR9648779.1 nitroreductase family protein [Clostridium tyrobutyricum]MBV4415814.1 nitroreductase family protein [Clostridium tyrobutyricum]MBV4422837.1 nitroreductase family protein [Clostridium tyrobutyricum]